MIREKLRAWIMTFIMLIFACFTVLATDTVSVNAEENKYHIDSADFRVDLEKSGDAEITEHWTVTFEKGDFTRFYKDVCNAPNQLEYIRDLQITDCSINGSKAEQSLSADNADGHYYLETTEEKYTINWYKAAHDETVTYDVTYRIPDAVKVSERDRAEFCFRLIGDNFEMKADKVTTVVNMPAEDSSVISYANGASGDVDGRSVYFSAENVSGVYRLRMDMSTLKFKGLKRVDEISVPSGFMSSQKAKTFFGAVKIIFICIAVAGAIVFVFTLIISPSLKEKKIRKMIMDDPDQMKRKADEIGSCGIPPVWYLTATFRENANKRDTFLAFCSELFELRMKGYLEIEAEGIRIKDNSEFTSADAVQDKMDRNFIERLKKMITLNGETADDLISYSVLKKTAGNRVLFLGQIKGWLDEYGKALTESNVYKRIESENRLPKLKEELSFWRKYGHCLKKRVSTLDCFELLKRTDEIDTFTFLSLINIENEKVAVTENDALADFLSFADKNFDASGNMYGTISSGGSQSGNSNSGTGCASCGSCGGCGGGGAE